ncbi:uncharacterized protein [Triticum aestivum]|uniref:uncharacterized protein n=1 Tax=Triticum aestivum TaxID=4565 RepID=UPI001D02F30E|nr:uncharacterized protein LOC123055974 [Triticum aestivum]
MIIIFELWFPTLLLVMPLLRRSELEADYIGMLLAAAAGFDPHAAAICLDKAGKRKGESAFTNFLSFFSSKVHPSCKKRSRLLSQPKVMEEAMELYRKATEGDGLDNDGFVGINYAKACREAMALATDLLQTHIVIGSDCKETVSEINEGSGGKHGHIIREIRITSSEFQDCSFVFKGRASNTEAHSLAKHALSLSVGRHLWPLQPPINCIPPNIIE